MSSDNKPKYDAEIIWVCDYEQVHYFPPIELNGKVSDRTIRFLQAAPVEAYISSLEAEVLSAESTILSLKAEVAALKINQVLLENKVAELEAFNGCDKFDCWRS